MEKSNTNRSSKHKIAEQGIRCQHARGTQALIFKSSFNLLHHTLLTSPQNDCQFLSQSSLDEGIATGEERRAFTPSLADRDPRHNFMVCSRCTPVTPHPLESRLVGMTPPARAHTHPSALSPSLYAVHFKHPFCFQHQILIPAPELKNCKEVKATHHFIIDFMKMNLADLFHHILVLESYKAESCEEGEDGREKTGEERKGGKSS